MKHLSSRHRVYAASFIDDENDWQYVDTLKGYCADVLCVPLDRIWSKARALSGLGRGRSASRCIFTDSRLTEWVGRRSYDAALISCSSMAHSVAGLPRPARVVLDYVDVDSDKWAQYARTQPLPARWIYAREARVLLEEERRLAEWVDAGTFVSEAEAALFRTLAPRAAGRIHGISNGIDHAFFAPGDHPDPFDGRPTLVFTGAMDYWPNVDAVTWFAAKVWPRLAGLDLAIVGSNPTREVRALARPGMMVTGRVPDVRPYLAHAAAVVAPMRVARGVQNKVLEGMSMARPVITTPQGFEGIDAQPGRHLLVAEGAEEFARAITRALTDPALAGMGQAARACMLARYDWADKLARFEDLLLEGP